jgi:hypothetical protein
MALQQREIPSRTKQKVERIDERTYPAQQHSRRLPAMKANEILTISLPHVPLESKRHVVFAKFDRRRYHFTILDGRALLGGDAFLFIFACFFLGSSFDLNNTCNCIVSIVTIPLEREGNASYPD